MSAFSENQSTKILFSVTLTCCVTTMREMDVVEYHIVDVVWLRSVLSYASNTHAP